MPKPLLGHPSLHLVEDAIRAIPENDLLDPARHGAYALNLSGRFDGVGTENIRNGIKRARLYRLIENFDGDPAVKTILEALTEVA